MSKIYHSGSEVRFENVRFEDMESVVKNGSFFVPVSPEQNVENKAADPKSDEPPKKEEPAGKAQPPVDVEAIKKEAFAKGRQAGRQEMEETMHSASQALAKGLEEVNRLRESLLVKGKEDMVRLVMAVASRVIHAEVEEKEDVILKTITNALHIAVQSDEYHIKVHPDDIDRVKENEPLFFAAMKSLKKVHFVADESVTRGGCVAESQAGDVDATIESQLEEIDRHLRSEILE